MSFALPASTAMRGCSPPTSIFVDLLHFFEMIVYFIEVVAPFIELAVHFIEASPNIRKGSTSMMGLPDRDF